MLKKKKIPPLESGLCEEMNSGQSANLVLLLCVGWPPGAIFLLLSAS